MVNYDTSCLYGRVCVLSNLIFLCCCWSLDWWCYVGDSLLVDYHTDVRVGDGVVVFVVPLMCNL